MIENALLQAIAEGQLHEIVVLFVKMIGVFIYLLLQKTTSL